MQRRFRQAAAAWSWFGLLTAAAGGIVHNLAAAATPTPTPTPASCQAAASDGCFFALPLPEGVLHFYASLNPDGADSSSAPSRPGPAPTRALVAIHGHSHDANKTFNAAWQAVRGSPSAGGASQVQAGAQHEAGHETQNDTLVVAPLFQVDPARAAGCSTRGVPAAAAGDLLWTCSSWQEGAAATNGKVSSFAALDALIARLVQRWPSLRTVTIAGFSAGAQMAQRHAAFGAPVLGSVALRYVIADPGSWLYFDSVRPFPPTTACPQLNRWKYGTDGLPASLGRTAVQARAAYVAADIHYLQGALDDSDGPGTASRVLDRSCAAMAQGPFRLQRGLAYADYDRRLLAPDKNRQVTVVPGCAHDVACVFPAASARAALLGLP